MIDLRHRQLAFFDAAVAFPAAAFSTAAHRGDGLLQLGRVGGWSGTRTCRRRCEDFDGGPGAADVGVPERDLAERDAVVRLLLDRARTPGNAFAISVVVFSTVMADADIVVTSFGRRVSRFGQLHRRL